MQDRCVNVIAGLKYLSSFSIGNSSWLLPVANFSRSSELSAHCATHKRQPLVIAPSTWRTKSNKDEQKNIEWRMARCYHRCKTLNTNRTWAFTEIGFHASVETLISFALITPHDWLKKLAPLYHPIRSKTKTNRDSFAHVFPRLRQLRISTWSLIG